MPVFLRWLLRLGPTNPIGVRLVQGGSRRVRHLYIRAVYLGVLIIGLLWLLLAQVDSDSVSFRELASIGASAFTNIAYLQVALICILAPVFMAGAIAQEANPKTWDILLTTPLSAGEIVLGNLLGRLFFILALLFSSLPLFAVTQYFGGVPSTAIFGSYFVAASAAVLVGSIAIALSVSRLVGRRAVFAFYVTVVSYLAVTWAADRIIAGGTRVTWLTGLNPFLALRALLDNANYQSRDPADPSLGWLGLQMLAHPVRSWTLISVGISVLLVGASTLTVRIGGIAGLGGAKGKSSSIPWYRRMFGLGAAGAETRPARTPWHNPIAWREAAARNATLGKMLARWSFIGAGGLFGLAIILNFHFGTQAIGTFRDLVLYTTLGELIVISLIAINMSATSVAREREDGTLDLLLTTPITSGAYLSGKLRGIIAYLLPLIAVPLGTLGFAGAYVGLVDAGVLAREGGVTVTSVTPSGALTLPAIMPESIVVATIVTIPFMAFCVMVGTSWSLKSKASLGAVVATVGVVGVTAGILGLCAHSAGQDVEVLGPGMATLSPLTTILALVLPEDALNATLTGSGLAAARVGLFFGALISAALHIAVVYGIRAHMLRTFDFTVRKLAGGR